MTFLVDHEIKEHMKYGSVVIEPFNEEQLAPQSYDLTLGRYFWRYNEPIGAIGHLNLKNPAENFHLVEADCEIKLAPGERVLGHTREVAGGRVGKEDCALDYSGHQWPCCTSDISTTSTAARLGISAHPSAGHGEPGYVRRWTLEVRNESPRWIYLPVGAVICQILFAECAIPDQMYDDVGQYMSADEWTPEDMLPKPLKVVG